MTAAAGYSGEAIDLRSLGSQAGEEPQADDIPRKLWLGQSHRKLIQIV